VTPITRRGVKVASNLVIIATMNPRDRSALEIDEALIRRLRIIDCPPDPDQLREMLAARALREETVGQLAEMFEQLRAEHGQQLFASLMPFGHGVFAELQTEADLSSLWRQQIWHLLYRPLAPPHPFAARIEALYPFPKPEAEA
jgi:5-methylcytosine-specific restriction protein B